MRKEFRATAESRKRPPLVAEAMVDADVEIPGVIAKGKLLTLTTEEALKHKVADFRADSIDAVLEQLGLAGAEVRRPSAQLGREAGALPHPSGGQLAADDHRHPRHHRGAADARLRRARRSRHRQPRALLLGPLAGAAGRLGGAAAGGLGLVLLALEIFVMPGFGLTGVLGIAALLGGLGLSLVGAGATWEFMLNAVGRVVFSLLLALVVAWLAALSAAPAVRPPARPRDRAGREEGFASAPETDRTWLGKRGTAASPLRPAGIADIEGERVDVVSDGEFIDAGAPIVVTAWTATGSSCGGTAHQRKGVSHDRH